MPTSPLKERVDPTDFSDTTIYAWRSPREEVAKLQSVHDTAHKRYVSTNINDYFEIKDTNTGNHKCINCAKCLSPHGGKLIQYKYPSNIGSVNNRFFKNIYKYEQWLNKKYSKHNGDIKPVGESFNYDRFRK